MKDKTKVLIPQETCCKILLIFHKAIIYLLHSNLFWLRTLKMQNLN